jgi:uroporphyrinogen-III synthase
MLPTLAIMPCKYNLHKHLQVLNNCDTLIFVSVNAVNYFLAKLPDLSILNNKNLIAVGQASKTALEGWELRHIITPSIPNSEGILQLPCLKTAKKILLIKGVGGRNLIKSSIQKRNIQIDTLSVYKRDLPTLDLEKTRKIWQNNEIDAVIINSVASLKNLFLLFDTESYDWLKSKICIVISERLAKYAKRCGFTQINIKDV